ncbi:hypothetical protein BU24DRAFT_404833 [Aaosphaeria arxii CBS 175.79]|uniref:Uncharacterized protein n=1 Tax=Aaosphaeria arxii CBS 175.79 TaxID=1450172 RepID=A0A6A5Y984_9PLEO|nr:uncharacterized protein BU24DRAFT_404833 [Aaosphaeria arxii CBS 175.79]KAF2021889.1 hypothetical protein BU24DRAFT_404833 [Aaosphaeria arxii CBS 175.79]
MARGSRKLLEVEKAMERGHHFDPASCATRDKASCVTWNQATCATAHEWLDLPSEVEHHGAQRETARKKAMEQSGKGSQRTDQARRYPTCSVRSISALRQRRRTVLLVIRHRVLHQRRHGPTCQRQPWGAGGSCWKLRSNGAGIGLTLNGEPLCYIKRRHRVLLERRHPVLLKSKQTVLLQTRHIVPLRTEYECWKQATTPDLLRRSWKGNYGARRTAADICIKDEKAGMSSGKKKATEKGRQAKEGKRARRQERRQQTVLHERRQRVTSATSMKATCATSKKADCATPKKATDATACGCLSPTRYSEVEKAAKVIRQRKAYVQPYHLSTLQMSESRPSFPLPSCLRPTSNKATSATEYLEEGNQCRGRRMCRPPTTRGSEVEKTTMARGGKLLIFVQATGRQRDDQAKEGNEIWQRGDRAKEGNEIWQRGDRAKEGNEIRQRNDRAKEGNEIRQREQARERSGSGIVEQKKAACVTSEKATGRSDERRRRNQARE